MPRSMNAETSFSCALAKAASPSARATFALARAASLLDPFSGPMAPFGISADRYKGQYKLEGYMDTDAYYDAYDAYTEARDKAE